jgi:hypothetical protein
MVPSWHHGGAISSHMAQVAAKVASPVDEGERKKLD